MKTCRKCKVEKPLSDFGNRARNSDGLQNQCRACKNVNDRNYLAANPANPEKAKESSKKYYDVNREERKEYSRNYRASKREKVKETRRKYTAANSEKVKECDRNCRVARLYGMSAKCFEQMQLTQGGACAICKIVPKKRLHIDHNHTTGEVRALLCGNCNLAIGHLQESETRALAVAAYLKKHQFPGTSPGLVTNQKT